MTAFVVDSTLVEISTNAFFSLYFGVLFMIIGIIIATRVHKSAYESFHRKLLLAFSVLIVVSGGLCVVAQRHTFHLSPPAKVPLYATVGISVTFALVFSTVDMLNYCAGTPLVDTPSQIIVVLVISVVQGAIYGFVFGLLDVEDQMGLHLQLQLLKDATWTFPVGAVLGGVGGYILLKLRRRVHETREYTYDPVSTDDFFDDDDDFQF